MNVYIRTAEGVRELTNAELIDDLIVVAAENRESDCRDALRVLRQEAYRRFVHGKR